MEKNMVKAFHSALNIWNESSWEERLVYLYAISIPCMDHFIFIFCGKKVLYADFIFAFLFILLVVKYLSGKVKIDFAGLKYQVFILPLLFTASFLNSSSLSNSGTELIGLIYLLIVFIVVINVLKDRRKMRFVSGIYFITAAIVSSIGLFSLSKAMIWGGSKNNSFLSYGSMESVAHHFPRLDLTFGSANMALTYLHIAMIFGIFILLTETKKSIKLLIALLLGIVCMAAFFTGSRRLTGFMLTVFILLCWHGRGMICAASKHLSLLLFIFLLIASIVTSIWVVFPVSISRNEANKSLSITSSYAYSVHYLLPIVSLKMFKEHPFIGVGYGTFNRNFKEYVDWDWLESSFGFDAYPDYVQLVKEKKLNFDPHSVFFGMLAETGLVGFAALIFFLTSYAYRLVKRLYKSQIHSYDNILYGCIFAGFVGFVCNALTLDILSMRHFWFMLAIGMIDYGQNKKN